MQKKKNVNTVLKKQKYIKKPNEEMPGSNKYNKPNKALEKNNTQPLSLVIDISDLSNSENRLSKSSRSLNQKSTLQEKLNKLKTEYEAALQTKRKLESEVYSARIKANKSFSQTNDSAELHTSLQILRQKLNKTQTKYKSNLKLLEQMKTQLDEYRMTRFGIHSEKTNNEAQKQNEFLKNTHNPIINELNQKSNELFQKTDEFQSILGKVLDFTGMKNINEVFYEAERLERENKNIDEYLSMNEPILPKLIEKRDELKKNCDELLTQRQKETEVQNEMLHDMSIDFSNIQIHLSEIETQKKNDENSFSDVFFEIEQIYDILGCDFEDISMNDQSNEIELLSENEEIEKENFEDQEKNEKIDNENNEAENTEQTYENENNETESIESGNGKDEDEEEEEEEEEAENTESNEQTENEDAERNEMTENEEEVKSNEQATNERAENIENAPESPKQDGNRLTKDKSDTNFNQTENEVTENAIDNNNDESQMKGANDATENNENATENSSDESQNIVTNNAIESNESTDQSKSDTNSIPKIFTTTPTKVVTPRLKRIINYNNNISNNNNDNNDNNDGEDDDYSKSEVESSSELQFTSPIKRLHVDFTTPISMKGNRNNVLTPHFKSQPEFEEVRRKYDEREEEEEDDNESITRINCQNVLRALSIIEDAVKKLVEKNDKQIVLSEDNDESTSSQRLESSGSIEPFIQNS